MPTNTLGKIRHSLSCVAVLFGLPGIFVLPHFRLPVPGFIWEVWLRLLYIVLFLSMRLPPGVFIQSIIRFYHWAAYHLWNVLFQRWPWCALPFSTMLLVARNPGWPSYQGNFFFINFLTRWRCAFWLLWRRKLYSEVFIKQQYRLGAVLKSFRYYYLTRFCNYAYTISLCGDFCLSVCFFIDIMRCSNEKPRANDTDNTLCFK